MLAYLPVECWKLADLVDPSETRFGGAASCIRVVGSEDGPSTAYVTDGKRAVIVQGDGLEANCPGLADVPEWGGEVLVPVAAWKQAFQTARDLAKARRCIPEMASPVGIGTLADGRLVLATEGGSITLPPGEGRFPNVDQVCPAGRPVLSVTLDPKLLAQLLAVLAQMTDEDHRGVELRFYGFRGAKPVGLVARNKSGLLAEALIVPMVSRTE